MARFILSNPLQWLLQEPLLTGRLRMELPRNSARLRKDTGPNVLGVPNAR
jgi:hypothetical protein